MKIIEPNVELLWITPEAEKAIERAGRVAYKSEDKITETSASAFVKMIIGRGHEAVIEHASASLLFATDRGVTHEKVRHRIASYTQESTRYCNYGKEKFGREISVIQPPFEKLTSFDKWLKGMLLMETLYMELLDDGEKPQIARSVLPTCLKTEIAMTANLREWRHFFKLRCATDAHPQMRQVATKALRILSGEAPAVFADLKERFLA